MKNNQKRQIVKMTVFITSVFVIFLSVTYAFVSFTLSGSKKQIVSAGSLSLLITNEVELTLEDAYPIADEVGMIGQAGTFDLVNQTSNDTNYQLYLEDVTKGDNKLDYDLVKVYIEKNENTKLIKRLSSLSYNEMTIDSGVIAGNETNHYSLRLWISEEVEDNSLIAGKTLSFKIGCKIAQDENELAKVDNYPEPKMELITTSASMPAGSGNLAEFKMKLSNVSEEILTFKPVLVNDNFEMVKSDGSAIDSITLQPLETLEYTYYVKNKNKDLVGTITSTINLEMESPYHETIITEQFITIYIDMESWLKANGAVYLSDAVYMSDEMIGNVSNAKTNIISKGTPDFNTIAPSVTYDVKVASTNGSFSTPNAIYMATDYSINPETGAFSLVSPTQDFVDGGNYTNYYTCNRIDANTCSVLYQIKSYTTSTSEGAMYYNVSTVNYEPYAKTTINDASGLYKSEDDYGDTFYYRGKIDNNYVKFGEFIRVGTTYYPSLSACTSAGNSLDTCNTNTKDMYWRIVRVNGDGSIRLIYSGETPGQEEQGVILPNTNSRSSVYNPASSDPTYLGYTYGKDFEERTSSRINYADITKTYQYYFYNEWPTYNSETETYEFSSTAGVKVGTWYENYEEIIENYPYTCWSTSKTCAKGKPYFTIDEYRNNDTQAWGTYTSVSSKSYEATINNTYNSTIKSNLDNWFQAVFMNGGNYKTDSYGASYVNYFSDTSFCNDRSIVSGNGYDFVPGTFYGVYNRLYTNKSPSLKCANKNDRYTQNDTTNGNGWLNYPVSLITADEVAMAGGKYGNVNTEYYLYNGDYYWTLSPSYFDQHYALSSVWYVARAGYLSYTWTSRSHGMRAVLNLKPDVLLASGDGTSMNPYEIKIN